MKIVKGFPPRLDHFQIKHPVRLSEPAYRSTVPSIPLKICPPQCSFSTLCVEICREALGQRGYKISRTINSTYILISINRAQDWSCKWSSHCSDPPFLIQSARDCLAKRHIFIAQNWRWNVRRKERKKKSHSHGREPAIPIKARAYNLPSSLKALSFTTSVKAFFRSWWASISLQPVAQNWEEAEGL